MGRALSPWMVEDDMGALRGAAPHAGMRPRRWRLFPPTRRQERGDSSPHPTNVCSVARFVGWKRVA